MPQKVLIISEETVIGSSGDSDGVGSAWVVHEFDFRSER